MPRTGSGKIPGMARSIWTGAISFGLVTVPVKLYSAVSRKSVRFHQLHESTGVRIAQRRVDPSTGEEVPYDEIVKGYEIAPEKYVVVTSEELEALDPKKTRTIDIEDFVALDEIDPIFYDHPYYLAPGRRRRQALPPAHGGDARDAAVAIAKVVIRQKESLVAIRADGRRRARDGDDDLRRRGRRPAHIDDLEAVRETDVNDRELAIAKQLVESLAGEFEPEKYHDTYREEVLSLIERKAAGEEIVVQPESEEVTAPVPDLMSALKASLDAVRKDEPEDKPKRRAPAKGKGDGGSGQRDGAPAKRATRAKAGTKK